MSQHASWPRRSAELCGGALTIAIITGAALLLWAGAAACLVFVARGIVALAGGPVGCGQ